MTPPPGLLRLQDAWRQVERHTHHMLHALTALRPLLPLDEARFVALTDEQVQDADQFILRFSKLQDVAGARLLPALLEYLEEPFATQPMLDKLNRLEQLEFIPSVERWQYLREIRNRFTHDYPDDPERNSVNLNLATEAAIELRTTLASLQKRLALTQPETALAPLEP